MMAGARLGLIRPRGVDLVFGRAERGELEFTHAGASP